VSELLIRGARLLGAGAPVDVVIAGAQVAAIAPPGQLPTAPGRPIEAEGRWVMPGLWDFHVHPTDWAAVRHRLDLRSASSAAECVAAVAARVAQHPGAEVVATGLWCAGWRQRPVRADLDVFDVPVSLLSGDAHSAVFNTAALARYQLAADADDDGWVTESAWFAVMPQIGSADDATRDRWVIEAGQDAAARGVVGIVDLDAHDTHAAWRRRHHAGFAAHRVRAGVWVDHLEAAVAAGLRTGDPVPGAGPLVTMGPLKIIADGSLNTGTAHCRHPFPGGGHGAMNLDQAALVAAMTRAAAAGIEASIHAIGDAALTLVLDAFEASHARGSVEHVQLATPSDIERLARLELAASIQPWHLIDDRDIAEKLWAGRTERAYVFAEMARAGIELRLGSDAPVAPLDPWRAITAAVLRTGDERPAWHPEQRLDLDQALRSSWGGVREVAPGGPADLMLLDDDPYAVEPADLPTIGVSATICAGRLTHSSL
jgi:predicted amidohydrolase YtcJ